MPVSDDTAELENCMRTWSSLNDNAKLSLLQDLHDHNWNREYLIEEYGRRYEFMPMTVLKTDFKRLSLTPTRSEEQLQNKINATPLKNTLQRLSEQSSINEALAELIDNVFDNFDRKRDQTNRDTLSISVYFMQTPEEAGFSEIIFRENSGGANSDDLVPLVRLGDTVTAGAPTIGAWGQGSKIACFSLAREIEIFTKAVGQQAACVYFPKGWLEKGHPLYESWDVGVYRADKVPEGETSFRFRQLRDHARNANLDDIKNYLERIYSCKLSALRDKGITVSINLEDLSGDRQYTIEPSFTLLEIEKKIGFAWLPDYSPVRVTHELEYSDLSNSGVTRRLKVAVTAELLQKSEAGLGGVYMFGNSRLFTPQPEQGDNVAIGMSIQSKRGKIRKYGPPIYRMIAFVEFQCEDGQSEMIPWAAPLKNRYNRNNIFHEQLLQLLYSVLYPFSVICEGVSESQLPFFSQQWLQLTAETKKARLEAAFPDLSPEQVEGVARHHTFEHDLSNVSEYKFASIQSMTDAPFGYTVSTKVRNFLRKINDVSYNLSASDFFYGFFSRAINQMVAENIMEVDSLPDPAHLNMPFITMREAQAEVVTGYEAGTIRLEPEEKERYIRTLNLSDTASVTEIVEAALQRMMMQDEEG